MSYLTDVIVFCLADEEEADGSVPAVDDLNSWLVQRYSCTLRRVSRVAGGRFRPRTSVWMCTINYINIEGLLAAAAKMKWRRPEAVTIAWRSQNQLHMSYRGIKHESCAIDLLSVFVSGTRSADRGHLSVRQLPAVDMALFVRTQSSAAASTG